MSRKCTLEPCFRIYKEHQTVYGNKAAYRLLMDGCKTAEFDMFEGKNGEYFLCRNEGGQNTIRFTRYKDDMILERNNAVTKCFKVFLTKRVLVTDDGDGYYKLTQIVDEEEKDDD